MVTEEIEKHFVVYFLNTLGVESVRITDMITLACIYSNKSKMHITATGSICQ